MSKYNVFCGNDEITEYILSNTFTLQKRIDEAFALGSFTAWISDFPKFNRNVKPTTLIRLEKGGKSYYYVGSSKCKKVMTEDDLYIHNFEFMDALAITANYIVGSKAFSISGTNPKDYDKLNVLVDLINAKYETNIQLEGQYIFDKEIVYNFREGYTLYDCIKEITSHYDYKAYVSYMQDAESFTISFIDVSNRTEIDVNDIIESEYSQNADMYSRYVEAEASNVVDRTTTVVLDYVACRGEELAITTDNAHIEAPSVIEKVVNFGVYTNATVAFSVICPIYSSGTSELADGSTKQIKDLYANNSIFEKIYNAEFVGILSLNDFKEIYGDYSTTTKTFSTYTYLKTTGTTKYSLIDKIKHQSEWNLLTEQERCSYAVYTGKDNRISNLCGSYKNDLFSKILCHDGQPLLMNVKNIDKDGYVIDTTRRNYHVSIVYATDSIDPIKNLFYLEYKGINESMLLVDDKGEDYGTSCSRTYSCAGGYVDFDKLVYGMNVNNNTEGEQELQLVVDSTNTNYDVNQNIRYDRKNWYISSVISTFMPEMVISTLNLVKGYNKVADAVAVESQINDTKNPIEDIVDRTILFNMHKSNVEYHSGWHTTIEDYTASKQYYMKLTFSYANSNKNPNKVYFIPVDVKQYGNTIYFTAKAQDQYSIMMSRGVIVPPGVINAVWNTIIGNDSVTYRQKYNSYVDENNECYNVRADIVRILAGSLTDQYRLPVYNENATNVYYVFSSDFVLVNKDARERLIFECKAKL